MGVVGTGSQRSWSAGTGSRMCGGSSDWFVGATTFPLLASSWLLAGVTTFYHWDEEKVVLLIIIASMKRYASPS